MVPELMQAYLKRYGHQLSEEKRAEIERLIRETEEEAEETVALGSG